MSAHDTSEQFRDVALFDGLSAGEIATILVGATRLEVEAGKPVFVEGEASDACFLLERGRCVVRRRGANGKDIDLATLEPKTVIGEMGVLGKKPRMASVYAAEPAVVWRIGRERIAELIEAGDRAVTKFAIRVAQMLSDRLDKLNKEFSLLSAKTTPTKSAEELQSFKDKLYKEWSF
jgi:CRP-like cAMP-binding protein